MAAGDLLDLLGGWVNFLIHVSVLVVAAGEGSDIARKKLSTFSTVSMTQLVRTITLLAHHTVPRSLVRVLHVVMALIAIAVLE